MDAWMQAMRAGDFESAWGICDRVLHRRQESRDDNSRQARHLQHLWDGRPLDGQRVLVHCYHGLGDTIQFVRLLPQLRARAREVILWAQPQLLDLLRGIQGIDRLEPLHDDAPRIARDADIELMELPHILRLSAKSIPARVPYLRVQRRTQQSDLGRKRVGIAWRAGGWDSSRSIPSKLLAPLGGLHGIRWASLQFAARGCPLPAGNLACADFHEQARRMLDLDLVISVDTAVAHLAGALGLPTWLLLPTPCDWRWMVESDDTPWYPTMRLFRQHAPGDWPGVVMRVRGALAQWAQQTQEDNHVQSHFAQPDYRRIAAG
jgi:hypothetical protein